MIAGVRVAARAVAVSVIEHVVPIVEEVLGLAFALGKVDALLTPTAPSAAFGRTPLRMFSRFTCLRAVLFDLQAGQGAASSRMAIERRSSNLLLHFLQM